MAPVPSDDKSNHHSEANASTETSTATTPTTTPPSRSSISHQDNPFIQFRRFADSQISSLLQSVIGLPSLFERPSPTARWIVIQSDGDGNEVYVNGDEVTMRKRRELEEGWRKQKEQEAEERAGVAEAVREDNMGSAPSSTKTATPAPSDANNPTSKKSGGLLDWLGWDGRQKHEDKQDETTPRNGPMIMPSVRMTVSDKDNPESLNPFSGNMSEAVKWLLTDEYSPIFLRGHIPKDIYHGGPSFYHALHHPHWPDFRAVSSPDRFEEELRFRVPWCDAFEDLVSLQQNGHMIDRDEPTRTSSAQWLNDMIKRGSLGPVMSRGLVGPQWSTEYARLVSPFDTGRKLQYIPPAPDQSSDPTKDNLDDGNAYESDPVLSAFDIIREIAHLDDDNDDTDDLGNPQHWIGEISDSLVQAVAKDLMKPGVLEELRRLGFTSETQVLKYLLGDGVDSVPIHGFLMAPPNVVAAAMRAAAASEKEPSDTGKIANEPRHKMSSEEYQEQPTDHEDQSNSLLATAPNDQASSPSADHPSRSEVSNDSLSFTSSSSSVSSWSRWGSEDNKLGSIVSTMTTTERRTLPDGSIETKRVLKKRFADGREESNESVERQIAPSSSSRSSVSKPSESGAPPAMQQDKQTQTEVKETPQPKKGGWFWRE